MTVSNSSGSSSSSSSKGGRLQAASDDGEQRVTTARSGSGGAASQIPLPIPLLLDRSPWSTLGVFLTTLRVFLFFGACSSLWVYVGNLSWAIDDLALKTLFIEQGKVIEAKVVYDKDSGRSRGFGFVTFGSSDEVNNAIESLDGKLVQTGHTRPPRHERLVGEDRTRIGFLVWELELDFSLGKLVL
ncbi:hypothetical protein ACSBR2_013572 [Camellia fascicularis]